MKYTFVWNYNKARLNIEKHKISFEESIDVFRDPYALTIYDDAHSDNEDRWITLGNCHVNKIVVVCPTHVELSANDCSIRIISARKATKREMNQYYEELK